MRQQFRLLCTAVCFFTRLPLIRWAGSDTTELNQSVRYFPLVGIIVGASAALSLELANALLPLPVAVIISMMTTILITGGFHEDGLADALDGLGGGWSREQILMIMKDSRLGSYGALGLVLALLLKFQTLSALNVLLLPAVLITGHSLSRLAAVWVIATQTYVRETGKAKPLAHSITASELWLANISGCAPLLLLPFKFWPALIAVGGMWLYFSHILRRNLNGYTGDCLGAMQQLCELTFYLGVLACSSI